MIDFETVQASIWAPTTGREFDNPIWWTIRTRERVIPGTFARVSGAFLENSFT